MELDSAAMEWQRCRASSRCESVTVASSAYPEDMPPRVWGAEAPSSKPEWLKTHEVGFELRRRNLLWEILEALYNKSRFEITCATARERKILRKSSKWEETKNVEAAGKRCKATLA